MVTELARFLPSEPKLLRVLDLGSGAGMQAWQLASYGRFDVAAVDCVGEFLIEAPESVHSHPNVKMFYSNLETVPFEDHAFDIVFCKESLHHISDLRVAFSEIVRVAKPGALLVIKEPLWPCRMFEEREAFKLTDRAAKVGITHAYYCFNDYMQFLDTISETLLLHLSPARDWLGRQLLWFATDSRRLPQLAKQVFKLLELIYAKIWKILATRGSMNKWGGEIFVIAKIKNNALSHNFRFDRTIVPFDVHTLNTDSKQRATIKRYNEKIFEVFARETKVLMRDK
jgi:SAM-dependent methyltransferase